MSATPLRIPSRQPRHPLRRTGLPADRLHSPAQTEQPLALQSDLGSSLLRGTDRLRDSLRRRQCPLNIPPDPQPRPSHLRVSADLPADFHEFSPLTPPFNPDRVPSVDRLLRQSRPVAIPRLVIPVHVPTLDRVRLRGPLAHVRQERGEIQPALTDRDSSATVVAPGFLVRRIQAAGFHPLPTAPCETMPSISLRRITARPHVRMPVRHMLHPVAELPSLIPHISRGNLYFGPTTALTEPYRLLFHRPEIGQWDQEPELSSGKVMISLHFLYVSVTIRN